METENEYQSIDETDMNESTQIGNYFDVDIDETVQDSLPNIPEESKTSAEEKKMLLVDWAEYPISLQKWVRVPENGYNKETGCSLAQVEFLYNYGLVLRGHDGGRYVYWLPSIIEAKHKAKDVLTKVELDALVSMTNWGNAKK